MLKTLRPFATRIVIGIAFFIFGFFVTAHALDMSMRDIVVGLISGAVGGLTILVVSIGRSIPLPAHIKTRLFGA
jgi:hypothetical protein